LGCEKGWGVSKVNILESVMLYSSSSEAEYFWIQLKVQQSKCKVQQSKLKVQQSKCKVQQSKLKVQQSKLKGAAV
jgi:hypothetical protein